LERLAIIGLGLVGTSIGLALKKAKIPDLEIVGHDMEPTHSSTALRRGAVDKIHRNLFSAIEGAHSIILAVPVMAMKDVMTLIAPNLEPGTIITDTGSTKAQVIKWAEEILPAEVSFIGGHPMAGKEQSGPDAGDENLFQDAVYAICPSPTATTTAQTYVVSLAESVGSRPYFVGPEEHDSYVAAVSHLPFILSIGLVSSTTKSPGWREMSRMASTGYRDISRLASGDPIMHRDICITNAESIVYWVDEAIKQLYEFRNNIQEDPEALELAFIQAWEARARWLARKDSAEERPGDELPSSSTNMLAILAGDKVANRLQELTQTNKSDSSKYRKR